MKSVRRMRLLCIGEQYLLNESTLLLMIVGMFIRMTRSVVDSFKNAYQLFADVWSPIAEAAINLGCSLLFGYWWGLNGILLGSNLSLILIVLLWKPYYTFREGIKASSASYYLQFTSHCSILIICALISISFSKLIFSIYSESNIVIEVLCLTCTFLFFIVATYSTFYLLNSGMRRFTQRIINIIKHRI